MTATVAALMAARAAVAAPAAFDWQPARAGIVPRPLCFAYAPSLRAYACVGYEDEGRGHRAQVVDVIGIDDVRPVVQTHRLPKAEIDRRLSEIRFAAGEMRRARLVPGKWIAVAGGRVRYDWRVHEGDASYENLGDLTVRCPDGREIPLGARERGMELGEAAWAFWRPEAGLVAISVVGDDGGEGTVYHWVNTLVVDPYAICRGNAGVAGPVRGRHLGP